MWTKKCGAYVGRALAIALMTPLLSVGGCKSAPVASINAQPSMAAVGAVVALDADQSVDNNGETLTYAWRLNVVPPGSKAAMFAADEIHAWFIPDVAGTYTVQLTVSDKDSVSTPTTAQITAGPCGSSSPTVMGITVNPSAPGLGGPVALSATVNDADNAGSCNLNQLLTYRWSLTSVPPGASAQLNGSALLAPSFIPQVAGTYVAGLMVADSTGLSSPLVTQSITVSPTPVCGQNTPVALLAAGNPPAGNCQANNGGSCTVNPTLAGTAPSYTINAVPSMQGRFDMQLDASASTDADNQAPCNFSQPLSYRWEVISAPFGGSWSWQPGGGGGNTVLQTTLVNPTIRLNSGGNYQVRLTVSDGQYTSAPVLVTIKT